MDNVLGSVTSKRYFRFLVGQLLIAEKDLAHLRGGHGTVVGCYVPDNVLELSKRHLSKTSPHRYPALPEAASGKLALGRSPSASAAAAASRCVAAAATASVAAGRRAAPLRP